MKVGPIDPTPIVAISSTAAGLIILIVACAAIWSAIKARRPQL